MLGVLDIEDCLGGSFGWVLSI